MRAVDPDNCRNRTTDVCDLTGDHVADPFSDGSMDYATWNKIVTQRLDGDATSAVQATQTDGSDLVLWTKDPGSVVVSAAWSSPPDPFGNFCDYPKSLSSVFATARTSTNAAPESQDSNCGRDSSRSFVFMSKKGEEVFIDDVMYLIVKKTVPANGSETFEVHYSLSDAAFQADSTASLPSTGASTTGPVLVGLLAMALGAAFVLGVRRRPATR
jgi:LPXTG-motif cell wall-anchored protein